MMFALTTHRIKRVRFFSSSRARVSPSCFVYNIFNIYIFIFILSRTFLNSHNFSFGTLAYTHTLAFSLFLTVSPTHTYFLKTRSRYISRYMVESRFAKIVSAFFLYLPPLRPIRFPYYLIV